MHAHTHACIHVCACVLQDSLAKSSQHVKRRFKQNRYPAQSWKSTCKYRLISVCDFEDSYEPVWVNKVTSSLVKLLKSSLQKKFHLMFSVLFNKYRTKSFVNTNISDKHQTHMTARPKIINNKQT